ncbi:MULTISPECIES: thioredoxin [unclassified Arenimonas]|uniref:thioredoxin n=1 Tax=unclassified Arenimonas TaxID=2641713 RepID=UPI00086901CB|nr:MULTISPECIES: thioredoxin [unclassified Arenimonas]ODS64016.1 MAG: thioredoxin [Arenimonas sp. SCN 70-307]
MTAANPFVFDASLAGFEQDVLLKSRQTPVLVDFWATWCGPCRTLGPVLEKLAAEFNGGFLLAKVDVDKEQQLAGYFQIKSVPTVMLIKDGQIADAFPGALPEGQLRQFLAHHGVVAKEAEAEAEPEAAPPADPHEEVVRLRAAVAAEPDKDETRLDLALALLRTGAASEAEALLEALPANLAQDDRALRGRARLAFLALLRDAPPAEALARAVEADPADLRARHLLGAHDIVAGRWTEGLEQFLEMLRRDRSFEDGLPRRALIDAFRVVEDEDLVGAYRRKMASLLF